MEHGRPALGRVTCHGQPTLFRLTLKLRLGIPMLCADLTLTVVHGWYQSHTALADGIFFARAGLIALFRVVTLLRRLRDLPACR